MTTPQIVSCLDATARRVTTPAGKGEMVWRIWGAGEPLVLLHGGHGSWTHWIRNIPVLAARYQLFVPDIPGFGDSAPIVADTIESIAETVSHGLDRLGLGLNYFLAGFSYGCIVAGYVLPYQRSRVRRLILIGSAGLGRFQPVTGALRRWQETPDPMQRAAIHRHNLSVLMFHDPDRIDDLAVMLQSVNTERTVVNHRKAAIAANLRQCLETWPLPVSGIWGGNDALVSKYLDERREFLERLDPSSDFFVVPGAGHWVQYEAADAVNARMIDVIDRDLAVSGDLIKQAGGVRD